MAYTEKQRNTIEYLISRGKAVHKKLVKSKGTYESEKYSEELNKIKLELNNALNAEAMYKAHLRVAQEHIAAAEALKNEWCNA